MIRLRKVWDLTFAILLSPPANGQSHILLILPPKRLNPLPHRQQGWRRGWNPDDSDDELAVECVMEDDVATNVIMETTANLVLGVLGGPEGMDGTYLQVPVGSEQPKNNGCRFWEYRVKSHHHTTPHQVTRTLPGRSCDLDD